MSRGETASGSSSKNSKWIVLIAAVLVIAVFLMVFRTKEIDVTGNDHYTDAQVRSFIVNRPLSANTLAAVCMNRNRTVEGADFIDHIDVKMESPSRILVTVTEKDMAGYMELNGTYWYFDKEGTIVASSGVPEEYTTDRIYYPLVEGLPAESEELGEKVANVSDDILTEIYELRLNITGREQVPDRVLYDEKEGIILYYGSIKVLMGDESGIEDKISQLYGILPKSEGLSGTLHLEEYDGSQSGIVFTKD